jgi:hypothetical protein
MASLLASLGITTPTPDPAAYANQQVVAQQMTAAQSQLSTTTSAISLALTGAKLVGAPPASVQALTNLNTQAQSLATQNLTPAQLAAQTAQLESQLTTIQTEQGALSKQKAIAEMQAAIDKITATTKEVEADKVLSAGLRDKYRTLLKTAIDALASLKNPPPPPPASTAGTGSPGPAAPAVPEADDLLSQLDVLDTARDAEENKEFNMKRFQNTIFKQGMMIGFYIFIGFGALLGGIIMSNAYATEAYWGIRLYYFVYGAAFFPITLLYGAINPPYWVSLIFPAALHVPAAAAQAGGAFGLPSLSSIGSSIKGAAGAAVTKAKSAVGSAAGAVATKAKSAVGIKPAAPARPAPPVEEDYAETYVEEEFLAAAAPAPTVSMRTSNIFTYTLVNPKAPTAADTSGRTTLRILSIVNTVCLAAFGVYYGIVK